MRRRVFRFSYFLEKWISGTWVLIDPSGNSPINILFNNLYLKKKEQEQANLILNELKSYGDSWLIILPDCPCLEKNVKKSTDFYEIGFNPTLSVFHPGAEKEYRSQPRDFYISTGRSGRLVSRPAQQCTYKSGKLITSGKGAGTPDFWSSKYSAEHYNYDVVTFNNLSLDQYLDVWKPNQGDGNCQTKCLDK